jgi:ribonucleotide reductase alpha subunit
MVKKKSTRFKVRKRDGRLQYFSKAKLIKALQQSFHAARAGNGYLSKQVAKEVEERLKREYKKAIPSSEDILRLVHEVLIEKGYVDVANAYILFFQSTEKRERMKDFFGVRDDLHLGMNAMWLLVDRYLQKTSNGKNMETPRELLSRVAKAVATKEKQYGTSSREIAQIQEWFYDIMANKAFFPNPSLFLCAGLSKTQISNQLIPEQSKAFKKMGVCVVQVSKKRTYKKNCSITTQDSFMNAAKEIRDSEGGRIIFVDEGQQKKSIQAIEKQDVLRTDEINYGSINLAAFLKGVPTKGSVDWGLLRQVVQGAVRFLDNVIDVHQYSSTKQKKHAKEKREIGLGVMGFAELLVHVGVAYDSPAALEEAQRVMQYIRKEALRTSEQLAIKRGEYVLGKGEKQRKKKFRNQSVITLISSQELSLLADCSRGIDPFSTIGSYEKGISGADLLQSSRLFEKTARHFGFWNSHLLHQIVKTGSVQGLSEIPKRLQKLFKTAVEISPKKQIALQAAFEKCADGIVEQRIVVPQSYSEKEIQKLLFLAWGSKCKSIVIDFMSAKTKKR